MESGWNVLVWLVGVGGISMGVATGCGCKEVYRFPHTTYPYSSCIYSFFTEASQMFFVLVPVLFCNYILCINFFFSRCINTHTGNYGFPTAAI